MDAWISNKIAFFTGVDVADAFRTMASNQPCRVVRRASAPLIFENGTPIDLPASHHFKGERHDTASFLAAVETTGLLVICDGRRVFEQYRVGYGESTQAASWSVVKSIISALIGIAIRDGLIAAVTDQIADYVPDLKGTVYDGVTIEHALQMSSGVAWDETFKTPDSDVPRLRDCFRSGGSLTSLAKNRPRVHPTGSFNHYNTMDTQVLGMVLRAVSGRSLADYLTEELWTPLGMEDDAFWIVDGEGIEFAGGGLSATLRDNAKFGQLYLDDGMVGDRRILPEGWVEASIRTAKPHLVPGFRANSTAYWGYGYQWWIPDDSGCYMAVGAGNQFIYVDPTARLVIAKSTANRSFGMDHDQTHDREQQHLAVFRAIADRCAT